MAAFLKRFMGVLVLDPSAFEEIESHPNAAMQSVLVVLLVCAAGGFAARGLGLIGLAGFATGTLVSLGAFLVWAGVVVTLGTMTVPEPQTRSDLPELLRVLGFSTAPGVFISLAAMPAAAPVVFTVVLSWMVCSAVLGVRQALDYKSLPRAIAVCTAGWLLSIGVIAAAMLMFSANVS